MSIESVTVGDGKYRALIELGQGGTAIVRLGVAQGPVGFSRLVVLKSLKRELAKDPDFRAMFLNEARLSARLNHPNVVQVTEVVSDVGAPVIVMEYLDGKSLSQLRARVKGLSTDVMLRIITESLNGLHYSHELKDFDGTALGVVHRDMTPQNLFVTYDGQVKVLDFGIAKLSCSLVETQTGVIKGKLRYMPPEQIACEEVDRRVDIFATGVMLWEAACNRKMWPDYSDAAIMNAILRGNLPSPREVAPNVPEALEAIVMKALQHDRENRYPTADALREELEGYLSTRPPVALRDVGRMAALQFADERKEIRRLIDSQLKAASFSQPTVVPLEFTSESVSSSNPALDRRTPFTASGEKPAPRPLSRSLWLVLALSLALGAVVAWNQFGRAGAGSPSNSGTPAAAKADQAAPAPVNKAPVWLSVRATPESAQLSLDGARLVGNPNRSEQVADGARHVVRVEADGYVSQQVETTLDRDRELTFSLEPKARARAALHASAEKPTVKAASTVKTVSEVKAAPEVSAPAAPKPACSPPYFVDSEGVKRFKPECL